MPPKSSPSFTFHNVSINSQCGADFKPEGAKFTFHNVSINSSGAYMIDSSIVIFTFHNVSINSTDKRKECRND